jgi:DNA-binding NtrC family response regulator
MQGLVVENEVRNQEKLLTAFDEMRIRVEVADTSDAALNKLSARRFDLTVFDTMVPGPVSSIELARHNHPRMGTILIGEGEFADEIAGAAWSAPLYYLQKPIDYCLLLSCLRVFAEQARLRMEVARLQRELKALRGSKVPEAGGLEVDDLWFGIFDRLRRGPNA